MSTKGSQAQPRQAKGAKGSATKKQGPPNIKQSAMTRNRQRLKNKQGPRGNNQDKLLHAAGQRGTDVRAPQQQTKSAVQKNLIVTGYNNTLPVTAEVVDRSVSYVAMGIVLHALKNGYAWKPNTIGISPYGAFLRIIAVIKQSMDGSTPLLTNAPVWFWNLLSAVKPKVVPFKTGYIRYDWQPVLSGQTDAIDFNLAAGGGTTNYSVFWGVAGLDESVDVNGFYPLAPPPNITEEAQIESLQDLFGWFNSRGHKLVEGPDKYMVNDTSAFAAVYPELGSSFFSSGAVKVTTYSERQVDSPILAKFATYQPFSEAQYRGWQKGGVSAGSTCYLGARIPELETLDQWRNKTSPTFKFYNFDEFFEVLAFTLGLALEAQAGNAGTVGIGPCPLTSQEVQIILRQTMIPFFCNEMAQDLRYDGQWEEFLPFVVGPNGVAAGQYAMQLPMFLAENIRSVSRITAALHSRFGKDRQIQDIVPVLGRFSDRPQLGQYFYGVGSTLFRDVPEEVEIKLVDFSAQIAQNIYYLDSNGKTTSTLIAIWNEWISKLSNCLSGLVSLTPGPGCSALTTNIYTNLQVSITLPGEQRTTQVSIQQKKKEKDSKNQHYGKAAPTLKLSTVGAVEGSSYFNRVADVRLAAQLGLYEAIAPYIKLFVLPVNKPSDTENAATSFQSLQVWQVEPGFINRSSALGETTGIATWTTQVSAEERHRQMAAVDVKALISDGDNELISGLREMSKHGEGGFFSAIADLIGGATGLPLGPIARAIEGN